MKFIINKKGQEEMVGFALIVIIVAIILLILLGFYLSRPSSQSVKSYEAESFMQSMLQTSTNCINFFGYINVKDLIFACNSGDLCNGEDSCSALNSTLQGILKNSWNVKPGSSIKGYSLNITSNTKEIVSLSAGNRTSNSEGTSQNYPDSNGNSISIIFSGYY